MLNINNEKDLHYKVVDYLKNFIKEPIIIPGLGEHQINSGLRTDAYFKGYVSGQPDLILLNYHTHYKGLAIELKTPTGLGVISKNQQLYINALENNGFKTLISSNYDEIITTIIKYSMGIERPHNRETQETVKDKQEIYCRENPDILKKYNPIYYWSHRDRMRESMRVYARKKILCDCGKEYQCGNKQYHLKSSHHQKWLEENV